MSPDGTPSTGPARRFGRTFWVLNGIEMGERLAFYNLRVMAPIYIMQADNPGGLHLSAADKGVIYAWWAVFQSLLPVVTGGIADRFGYKRTLAVALSAMMGGHLAIAFLRGIGFVGDFWGFFGGVLLLATGTAFFKPALWGSLAQNLTKANSSVGWGIFYWLVNVGAFVGHYLPAALLGLSAFLPGPLRAGPSSPGAWRNLFLASAAVTGLNLVLLLFYRDVPTGASRTDSVPAVLAKTVRNLLDLRLLAWLGIMSGFWMMMYQLWDLQPNFIADWVDSGPLASRLGFLPEVLRRVLVEQTARGPQIPQQVLLSANAFFIILGVVPAAWLTRRMRTLEAMLIGVLTATAGVLVAGLTPSALVLLAGIVFFSVGEMTTGPKNNEYLGLIAPAGKKGLYLGYVNIPVGLGVYVGSKIGGYVYGHFGEKAVLALRYLAERTPLGQGKGWDGDPTRLEAVLGVPRTQAMARLVEVTGMDVPTATRALWDAYSPQLHVWLPFAGVGVVAAVALWIFGRMASRWCDMDA